MASAPAEAHAALRGLIESKEAEVAALRESRRAALEDALAAKSGELQGSTAALQALRRDFAHNLRVLDERDAELARYETGMGRVRALVGELERQLGEERAGRCVPPAMMLHTLVLEVVASSCCPTPPSTWTAASAPRSSCCTTSS